jgi:putative transposase
MPRSARVAPGGMVFHVLNRANARGTLFDDAGDYRAFEQCLAEVQALVPVELFCYCLMPNHWHLVLRPRGNGDLGRFMQRLTVTHVRRWHEHRHSVGRGHLYQGTYKSFPVQADGRGDRHFLTLCRYVERNALRAHLVSRAQDWQWSSLYLRRAAAPATPRASDAPGNGTAPNALRPVLSSWPVPIPSDWIARVNRPQRAAEVAALQLSLKRGRPLGEPAWQRQTAKQLALTHTFRVRGRPKKLPAKARE